jgi:DNA invertase Pin-like site-specific DNA recombinase
MTTAILYTRVSLAKQVEHGASLPAQEAALVAEATRRGWDYVLMAEEGKSAKNVSGRPVLQEAMRLLDAHKADVLMAVRLDRVSRSVSDFAAMMNRATKKGWGIAFTGTSIDTTDPSGRFSAHVMVAAAEFERALIGARTSEGMQQKKLEGQTFGRVVAPAFIPTYSQVLAMVEQGDSYNAIARNLNEAGTPTSRGGKWYASTVRAMVTSEMARTLTTAPADTTRSDYAMAG